jgi:hypothetical protein
MGNLTVALLEHLVEPVLGKDFIKELKLPYTTNQLRNKFRDALFAAERKFIQKNQGSMIAQGLIQLHIADLDSVQKAFWQFVENPASPDFPRALYEQFRVDYPGASDREKASAVDLYLKAIWAEVIYINEEIRQKVSAAVLLSLLNHVESIDEHAGSIDKKLDRLDEIRDLLARLVEPFAKTNVGDKPQVEKVEALRDSREVRHVSIQRIRFDIDDTLEELTDGELENLRDVLENWIPPLIEQYLDVDDADRPYGTVCKNTIETLLNRVETRFGTLSPYGLRSYKPRSPIKSEKEYERFGIVNRIFKSHLLKRLPHYTSKNSVYMNSLSALFPESNKTEEPYGFYLVDLLAPKMEWEFYSLLSDELHKKNGRHWMFNENSDRIQLIYISEKKLSVDHWKDLSKIEEKDTSQNWKALLKRATKTVTGKRLNGYFHMVLFEEKKVQFIPLDVDEIGYKTAYELDLSLQEFARFVSGFAEDFLSLASGTILTERQVRDKYKDIADQGRNKKID